MAINKHIIILAAGIGSRMNSNQLKVLHPVAGLAMIDHVLKVAQSLQPAQITVVYGHQADQLKKHLAGHQLNWALQAQQLGTGHAVQMAIPFIQDDEQVLVLYGDAPLISKKDLTSNQTEHYVLTATVDDPTGYGRILKDEEHITRIVEQKDATAEQLHVKEINSGILATKGKDLKKWLMLLKNNNAQAEYYLTDVIELAAQSGQPFTAVMLEDSDSVKGANDMIQLAELDEIMQDRRRNELMKSGVRLNQPSSIQCRGELSCGQDVVIDTGAVLEGDNQFADGVHIGAYSIIRNCQLAAGTQVAEHSVLNDVKTLGSCTIGPFARLRTGAVLSSGAKVGNFVEIKNTMLGKNSKASHLSYLGDAEIGDGVNIGAGTITCNYDGVNKFKTIIQDGVFIGSDTQLVAPVIIGKGATIGAGSTITKNTPDEQLTLSRSKQITIKGWKKPKKK